MTYKARATLKFTDAGGIESSPAINQVFENLDRDGVMALEQSMTKALSSFIRVIDEARGPGGMSGSAGYGSSGAGSQGTEWQEARYELRVSEQGRRFVTARFEWSNLNEQLQDQLTQLFNQSLQNLPQGVRSKRNPHHL